MCSSYVLLSALRFDRKKWTICLPCKWVNYCLFNLENSTEEFTELEPWTLVLERNNKELNNTKCDAFATLNGMAW